MYCLEELLEEEMGTILMLYLIVLFSGVPEEEDRMDHRQPRHQEELVEHLVEVAVGVAEEEPHLEMQALEDEASCGL
jgi:hypothetical protein